jgi:hypothetical protein
MRAKVLYAISLLAGALLAQEGHPLVGSWHGNWGPNPKDRTDITFVLNYDGNNIIGMINPGPDAAKLQKATLDASNWGVHLEADIKDKSGSTVHVMADGKIEDVTSVRRAITGTWTQGSVKGDFKVTRDD